MTMPRQDPKAQWQATDAARHEARSAIERLALNAGAQISTRPAWPGSDITVNDVDALAGLNAARNLELGARHTARDYIRQARDAGHTWHDIGAILNLTRDADTAGESYAEAAYDYAAGQPDPDAPWRQRSFRWTCRACNQAIADHGIWNGPADDEQGHAQDCPRLAATIRKWDAHWEAGE